MAENESMEGKDLAIEEKIEFERQILEAIKDLKKGETTISTEGIEVKNYGEQYTIKLKGITFGLIDKEGNFTYNKKNVVQVKKALEEEGITLEDLGLPDIEQWIDQKQEEKEEEPKDEKDLSNENEEEVLEQEGEEESDEITLEDIAEQEGLDELQKSQVIELRTNRKITDKHKLPGLIPEMQGYKKVFLIPDEKDNQYSYKIKGITHENKVEEIDSLKQTEGKNPNQKIVSINSKNSNKMQEETAVAFYERNDKEGIAIKRGQYNEREVTYYRRMEVPMPEGGTEEVYLTIPLPQQNTRNTDPYTTDEAKQLADKQKTSEDELEENMEKYFILVKVSKQNIPEEIDPTKDGIQVEEITPEKFENLKQMMIEGVTEELNQENVGHPDNRKNIAARIVKLVLDEGVDYKKAKDEILGRNKSNEDDEKDDDAKMPYDRINRIEH